MAYNGSLLGPYNEASTAKASGLWEFNEHYFYKKSSQWPPAVFSFSFQGSVSGYNSGGVVATPAVINVIEKFPFATDTNSSDVGDLLSVYYGGAGQSSGTDAYISGGITPGFDPFTYTDTIQKFPFASDTNSSDHADLTLRRGFSSNSGQASSDSGYTSGGFSPAVPGNSNVIDKFPFANVTNATDVGDLLNVQYGGTGQSSKVSGYFSGQGSPTNTNVIQKFPFSVDTNASDVGDLTTTRTYASGQSSTESGYTSAGGLGTAGPRVNIIDKFPFATDSNASDVGDLTVVREWPGPQSSTVSGYASGGFNPPIFYVTIDKFPFATDSNASDVGDLASPARSRPTGNQI